LISLIKVEERVGEVDNIFMAVDVGHSDKSKGRAESGRVSTEDNRNN